MSTVVADGGVKPTSKWLNIALWVLQVLVGLPMIGAGGAKLAGVEEMVKEFDQIGLGQWFRYLTGGWEVIAGILLLVPRLSGLGAASLIPVMIGAVLAHLMTKLGGSPVAPLVFLVMVVVIAWGRRQQLLGLIGK